MTATTTTAGQARPHVTPDPTPESDVLAGQLLERAGLRMRRDTPPQAARVALARILVAHPPASSPHGELLAAACRKRSQSERRRGPRPDPERAARALLERGQVPTPAAVAAQQRNSELRRQAEAARAVRIAPLVERDGADAARYTADYRRRTGSGPCWHQLRRHMRRRWRHTDGDAIIRALCAAGWLECTREQGSLRPGPLARGLTG